MTSLMRRARFASGPPAHERRVAARLAELGARGARPLDLAAVEDELAARREQAPSGRSNCPGTTPGIAGSRSPPAARSGKAASSAAV